MPRYCRPLLVTAAVVAFVLAQRASIAHETTPHSTVVEAATVSEPSPGRLVITFASRGELRGLFSLDLQVDPNGAVTGGDWALVSTYAEDLNPDGTPAAHAHIDESEHGDAHGEYIRIVDKGTLGGQVTAGFVGAGSNGARSLTVQLAVLSGSLTFANVRHGSGSVAADLGLTDGQGNLLLSF